MKLRHFAALFVAALVVSGCIYSRLLDVKGQLSEFDKNFRIEERRGLAMVFLNPTLLGGDIVWLMTTEPLSKKLYKEGELWEYLLEKQYQPGAAKEGGKFDIPVYMLFRDDKLAEITLPERFLRYLSKPLLARMLSSMGAAEINKAKQRADSVFQAEATEDIPNVEQFYKMMGKPFASREFSDGRLVALYRYKLRLVNPKPGVKPLNNVLMRFTFEKGDRKLLKAEGSLRGLIMSLSFSADEDPRAE
ncbi:MAG: hypothetical protein ACT4NX_09205 [Deltaproteobacteria bacterium]